MSARTVAGLNLFYKHNKHSSIRHEGIMKKNETKQAEEGTRECACSPKKNHRNKKNDKKLFMCDALFFFVSTRVLPNAAILAWRYEWLFDMRSALSLHSDRKCVCLQLLFPQPARLLRKWKSKKQVGCSETEYATPNVNITIMRMNIRFVVLRRFVVRQMNWPEWQANGWDKIRQVNLKHFYGPSLRCCGLQSPFGSTSFWLP